MKITCQACQAKYTIADDKVVGKIVKIRCKKCGSTIVVNGSEPGAQASQRADGEAGEAGAAFEYAKGAAQEPWTVNVDDGDQRTMTEKEVVAAHRSGIVNDETFCWKEGMPDWLPLAEIPALRAACGAGALPNQRSSEDDEAPTRIQEGGAHTGSVPPARPKSLPPRAGNGAVAANAARRAGGRAPDTDLFSSAAKAGGEDDVLTSLPAGDKDKRTGARNENSVLFALSDKADAGPPAKMTATTEASGLIDIRQLSAQMRSPSGDDGKKKNRVDDIMNLGGGGAFSPNLAAPVLSAPSLEHISSLPPPSMMAEMSGGLPAKNRALMFLAAGAGAFFLVAAAALILVLVRGRTPAMAEERERTSASGSAAEIAANPGTASTTNAPASAAVAPEAAKAAAAPPASASAPAAGAKDTPAPAKELAPASEKPAPAARPAFAAAPPKEAPLAAGGTSGGAEFNMGEARATLGAIAGGVQTCKRGDTTGSGKVIVTFAPSGSVQSASVVAGSPFDGTLTAKCVEARFRGAHVPAFGGSAFPVTKSFSIN